ncbi:hypothetical protein AAFF_G00165290 [Aldrovandia affinis]|uniref:Uncharacterized protein n=1 Tax=Aldrovandia affinis TaxID=143900 RepID=A0AAD7RMZ5_9TELE|nr:hypothetical protein AAFF_G00165290 [Aldrovandia affinis]
MPLVQGSDGVKRGPLSHRWPGVRDGAVGATSFATSACGRAPPQEMRLVVFNERPAESGRFRDPFHLRCHCVILYEVLGLSSGAASRCSVLYFSDAPQGLAEVGPHVTVRVGSVASRAPIESCQRERAAVPSAVSAAVPQNLRVPLFTIHEVMSESRHTCPAA